MEPHAVLGVRPGASPSEVARAYRDAAKRLHPDTAGDDSRARERRTRQMAEVNAAKDALARRLDGGGQMTTPAAGDPYDDPSPQAVRPTLRFRPRPAGDWLPAELRARMAPELLAALHRDEEVHLVVRTAMSDSHEVQLVCTAGRLLWLRDDAITNRLRTLSYDKIAGVQPRRGRFLRRDVGELRVQATNGRRFSFGELSAPVLDALLLTMLRLSPAR